MEDIITSLIPDTTNALDEVVGRSEQQFLLLGERLQSILETTCDLTEQTIASTAAVQGKNNDRLDRIAATASDNIDRLKSVQETIRDNTRIFPLALEHLKKLGTILNNTGKMARQVNTIAVEFMVETARLGTKDKNFTVLASEIKELSGQISKISDHISSESRDVEKSFETSKSWVESELKRLTGLLHEGEASVETAMGSIRKLTELSITTLGSATSVSENVNSQIEQIIISMQMQDNISQRISHVNQGLSDIRTLLFSDQAIGSFDYTPDQRMQLAWPIYRLQISQLTLVIADLKETCRNNLEAFEQIEEQIEHLGQMLEDTSSRGNQAQLLKTLSTGMDQLTAIREQGLAILARFKNVADKSVTAGANLSRQASKVRLISDDAHIKALNAIIASQKMLRNSGVYKILAMELKDRATGIAQFAEDTEQAIRQITDTTGQITTDSALGSGNDPAYDPACPKQDRPCEQLKALYQTLAERLGSITQGCTELPQAIKAATLDLNAVIGLAGNLEEILAGLSPMEEYFSCLGEPANDLLFDDPYFHERYTMDAERAVHMEALTEQNDLNALPQNDDSGQDLEDNIEFF